jgi:phage tail sheath protein FI
MNSPFHVWGNKVPAPKEWALDMAQRIGEELAAAIQRATDEWMALPPEEQHQKLRDDFIKNMAARGITGHFIGDTDEFVITEMPRPAAHITFDPSKFPPGYFDSLIDKEPAQ